MAQDLVKVTTIIVNWRQPKCTLSAVQAVINQSHPSSILVVDNGSNDGSLAQLKRDLPVNVKLLSRKINGGFGSGVNEGLQEEYLADAEYVWLLNNDAIPDPCCLEYLISVATSDPGIGVVGARIVDPSGAVPDHAGCVMSNFLFNCRYSLSSEEINASKYAWITGACMLLNVGAIRKVGRFDPEFFMYWEDADLCCRIKIAGYRMSVATKAIVCHEAGTSSNDARLTRYEWHINSQSLWVDKNYRFKRWGILVIYLRNLIKSSFDADWRRLFLTVRCALRRIY